MTSDIRRRIRAVSPPLLLSTALGLFAVITFAINLPAAREPRLLLWLAAPLSAVVAVVTTARNARTTAFAPPARTFWWRMAAGAGFAGLGSALNAWDTLGNGAAAQNMSAPTVAALGAAVLMLLWGMSGSRWASPGRAACSGSAWTPAPCCWPPPSSCGISGADPCSKPPATGRPP